MDVKTEMQKANNLISQGNADAALPIVKRLLQAEPKLAGPHFLMGRFHLVKDNKEAGLASATRAYELDPKAAYTKILLGQIYVDLRLPEFALNLLQRAQQQVPEDHTVNLSLGRCYLIMEKGHRARPHLETAVRTGRLPLEKYSATLRLCECLSAIGEGAEADRILDKAITDYPQLPEALYMRGQSVSKPVPAWLVEKLQAIIDDPHLSKEDHAQALLALGRCRDVEGQHELAFDTWSKSRALLGLEKHDAGTLADRNAKTRKLYTKAFLDELEPLGNQADSPIFIVGMPRSGTTLTAQVIGAHPVCINIGETDRIAQYDRLFRDANASDSAHENVRKDAEGGTLRQIAGEFTRFFSVFNEGEKTRVVEKSPTNYDCVGFIHMIFPKARIVHCRRHPADNFVSCFQHNMNRGHDYAYDQTAFVERYLAQEELMSYWKSCFPNQIFEMPYEDMIADQEGMTRKLIAFCGLPWDDACLNFHTQKSTVRTFSRDQVRKPLYSSSVERWRRYGNRLDPLFATLARHGYEYTTRRA